MIRQWLSNYVHWNGEQLACESNIHTYIIVGKKKCAEREKTNSWKLFFSVCEIESLAATWSVVHISYFHFCCAAIRCWHAIPTHPFRANFGTFIVHHHHHRHRHHNHEHTSVQTIIPSGLLFICLRARWHTNSIKIKCNRNINFDNRPTCIVWHNQRVDNVQTITPHHKTAKKKILKKTTTKMKFVHESHRFNDRQWSHFTHQTVNFRWFLRA